MSREKILYEETYRKGAAKIRKEPLPARLPYMVKLEFQDVRVYVDPDGGAS